MRTIRTTTLSILGGTALVLSLSACGLTISFDGEEDGSGGEQTAEPVEEGSQEDPEAEPDAGGPAADAQSESAAPQDQEGAGGTPAEPADGGSAAGSGEGGFSLDENGTGTIPAEVLEEDIRAAYQKQGTVIEAVECSNDMSVWNETGSASCTVTAGGRDYYGVAKVVSVSGQQVQYELEFAGIDF
ncbi:hypothetical protein [Brevibacterium album]|uniref:hypothetical protein n=1 Tax=Brevibacterium album TaxID=417948 RepID=UPI00041F98AA|nr:hypothetical protein [Brevibacterium album]